MAGLPTLDEIRGSPSQSDSPLATALTVLFEHSPILLFVLEPQLSRALKSGPVPESYAQLIDASLKEITKWDIPAQSEFISGHPRIGESKNLSNLSAKEQGAQGAMVTPPEVLARLAHLNACYEARYPGLRYITFVNGRSRAAIAEEMEDVLGLQYSLSPDDPLVSNVSPVDTNSEAWLSELHRAVQDVGRIARSRLVAIGVQ
ncbi:Oxo-4-hydroxy-4-carboxy-5-ureidoimidazoline decarboxylase [Crucibulum laeve]|uniref:Oxo-4-hydroxy-4-carboxy-5-ureidoimidazoline decarboxylase n=1 Tax=Crucibulum laeve TaxID=68775 RepID=A0A5C3M6E0_9AGAR|nr:Oxo-4-hydroxy-4-carboxy-5-ureidoimidazoline decarboxylase [Crucibulum laeve]